MAGKKRRIRIHRALSFVIAIVIAVVIAVVVFQKSGLLSYQLSKYVNDHYFRDTPYRFSCGKISGDMVGHVSLDRPVIHFEGENELFEVFRADRISLDYNLLQVLKLKMLVSNIVLNDVRIDIRRDDAGELLVPLSLLESDASAGVISPHIEVDNYVVNGLKLTYRHADSTISVRDLQMAGSFRLVDGKSTLKVDRATAFLPETDTPVRAFQLKLRTGPNGVTLDDLQIRLDRSFVMASGRYRDGRFHHVQAVFNPLDLDEISTFGFVRERGEVGGNVVVEGLLDSLSIRGSLTGKAVGLVFSGLTLNGAVLPDEVHLDNIAGTCFGSRINGEFTYFRGDGSYSFEGVSEGLDVSQGFIKDEGTPTTEINGLINLDFNKPQGAYEFRGDLRRSSIEGFEGDEIQVRIGYRKTSGLRIRSLNFVREGFTLSGSGLLDPGWNADLIMRLQGDDLSYISDFLALPEIGGGADLSGKLVGHIDRLKLNLNGSWEGLSYLFGTIDSSAVHAEARNIRSDDVQATIDIKGRALELYGRTFADPHVLLEASPGGVTVRDFSFSRGDTFITTDFEVDVADSQTAILFKHVVIQTPETIWQNQDPTRLTIDENALVVDSLVLLTDGHRVGITGTYWGSERRCDFNGWGRNLDVSLLHGVLDLPTRLGGSGDFTARMRGSIDNPWIDLSLHLANGVIDSLLFDHLDFTGGFNERGYDVADLEIVVGTDTLAAAGTWGFADSPVKIVREGFDKDSAGRADISVAIDSRGYPLGSVLAAAHQEQYWDAGFRGTVAVRGNLGAPAVDLQGEFVSREGSKHKLPPIAADVDYRSGLLSFRSLSLDDGSTRCNAVGSLPMTINLEDGFKQTDGAPLDGEVSIESTDLTAVAGYFDEIGLSRGALTGKLNIAGTADEPHYTGTFDFRGGSLRITGTQETYENLSAKLQLQDNTLQLLSLSATEGKKGRITGAGKATLRGLKLASYEVNLDLDEFTLSSIPDIVATQTGKLKVVSQVNADGQTVPNVTGAFEVKHAVITKRLGTEEGPPSPHTMPTESPSWLCKIELEAPKNVWLRNTDINMELSGDVIMRRDQQGLYFRGELSVLRGSYLLYNNKFRITEGLIDFSSGVTLRPGLRFSAYTPHRRAGEEERRIFLDLVWPTDKKEPEITLSYDAPGYSETDLWKMLGGQVIAGDAGLTSGGDFNPAGTAQSLASNYLERVLNARMQNTTIDVETRTLTGEGATSERETSIAVGRYLSEDLYFKYRQGLSTTGGSEVNMEYRISNMWLIRSEIIRHSRRGIQGNSRQATDEVNFDLKFRWEY